MLNALLIGRDHGLTWALPSLLSRAGFQVDVITCSKVLRHSQFIRNLDLVPLYASLLPTIKERIKKQYDWVVITEDRVLTEVLKSDLSLEDQLKILPVLKEENLSHLYSKIGLAKAFAAHGVSSPPSLIANNHLEAHLAAQELGYPVFLKQDSAGGGSGVIECKTPSDINCIKRHIFEESVLIQKKIFGRELDLSAIYLKGDLIHFNHAEVKKVCAKLGPSSLRTYRPLSLADEPLFLELAHIGKALGAHGFTNISCIESDGRRYYFEVDMRANAWIEFPRFLGEDPAPRIQKWFSIQEKLTYPVPAPPNQPSQLVIPYFLRLGRFELLSNRYDVWKFIPKEDPRLLFRLLIRYLFTFGIKHRIVTTLQKVIPRKYHKRLRKLRYLILRG